MLHLVGAFIAQSGVGLVVQHWPSVEGRYPAVYQVALAVSLEGAPIPTKLATGAARNQTRVLCLTPRDAAGRQPEHPPTGREEVGHI